MALRPFVKSDAVPIRGGAITVREKNLLLPGQMSRIQNVLPTRPGFTKRKGCRKLHATADSTNRVMSLYQFKKTRVVEDLIFAQMSDGDVLSATNYLPTPAGTVFGSEFADLTASGIKPASWGNLNDVLLYSHASDQHKLYPGSSSYIDGFVVVIGTTQLTTLKSVIENGYDYTDEVTGMVSTNAPLNNLDTDVNGDGFYIFTRYPAKSFTFDLVNLNTNDANLAGYYWKNDFTWTTLSVTDGTKSGDHCLGQDGTVTFTPPADIQERYLFGRVGYWYLFVVSAAVSAAVSVASIKYDSQMNSLVDVWDGVPIDPPEVLVEGTTQYFTYSSAAVDLDSLASGKKIMIASPYKIEGIYVDPGETPNATGDSLADVKYYNGAAMTSLTGEVDGTNAFSNPGWIIFPRADAHPHNFESSSLHAYWYEVTITGALSADTLVGFQVMPYFDVADKGSKGQTSCVWKGRIAYSFADHWPEYVYISAENDPRVLSGDDSGIVEVGDGRPHKIVCMKKFFNELLVWQEEKGIEGGTVTLIQGYNPQTFGKLVLSTRLGTMNAQSADVVENIAVATATTETVKTVAFFLSRYGVIMTDGRAFTVISDDIQNYFDPNDANCIRYGYEDKMWLKYDPVYNFVRIGLVCGSSATLPNVFLNYDVTDRCWYFDTPAQEFSSMEIMSAASGNALELIHVFGGVDDGTVYQGNYGTADVSTAIDTYAQMELPGKGLWQVLDEIILQFKAQAGTASLSVYANGIVKIDGLSLSTAAEVATQLVRRHWLSVNVMDPLLSVKIQNSSSTESMTIEAVGLKINIWENR